jgi:hypothetical protein
MLYKDLGTTEKMWKLPLRMVLDGVSGIKELLAGKPANVAAILKAHGFFYRWLFSRKDKRFFPVKRSAKPHGVYKGSIIWQYFIKNRKKFAQIIASKSR